MAKNIPTRAVISKKRRRKFLDMLAKTGSVNAARDAVGYASATNLYQFRRENEEFAAEWDVAVNIAADRFEDEVDRRAVEGIDEDIYFKGEVVGQKKVYSDALLQFRLRGMRPSKYNPQQGGSNINVKFGVAVLPMQADSEEDWESRAVDMHAGQQIITLEDKPVENVLEKRSVVTRGD
ncbi:MAG: hypothetical protein ACXABY_04775 [Candidatus Thorarchaeota archaeon]